MEHLVTYTTHKIRCLIGKASFIFLIVLLCSGCTKYDAEITHCYKGDIKLTAEESKELINRFEKTTVYRFEYMDDYEWYSGPMWTIEYSKNNEKHIISSLYNFGTSFQLDEKWYWIDPYCDFMDYYREIAMKYDLYLHGIDSVVFGGVTSCDVDEYFHKELGYDFYIGTWIVGEDTIVKDLMTEMNMEDDNEQTVLELLNELSNNQLAVNNEFEYKGIKIKVIKNTDDIFKKQFLAKKIEE